MVLAGPTHSQAYLGKPGQMDMSNPEREGGFALPTEDVHASTESKDYHEGSDWYVGKNCGAWIGSRTLLDEKCVALVTNNTWN